jgi:tetratricopeptide (TPR) repeat protein
MRRLRVLLVAAALAAPAVAHAQDDEWSITRHPGHPHTPPHHPGTPGTQHPGTPGGHPNTTSHPGTPPVSATSDPTRDRRNRMIAALTQSVLHDANDDSAPLTVLTRLVRERDGSIDTLVTDFETRARAANNDAAPHLALGHLYRESGRFEDALRAYADAERIAPNNPSPARAAGALYRRMDRNTEARAAYERSLQHTGNRSQQTDTLNALVEIALDSHDVPGARTYHARLIALDRTNSTFRRQLADALLSRHLYADAITEFQTLARAMSGDNRVLPPVLRDLGRAYAGNNQLDEALATYRRALAIAGGDAGIRREIYDAMTEVFTARNTLPQWITELERMGAGGRDAYERAVLLGRLQDQAGNTTGAIAAYRRAVTLRPNDIDAHVRIAQLYHQQGMRAEEIAEYRRLVALAPHESRFVVELADLLVSEGHADEAFRMLAEASARAGSDPDVHERLAEVYARHGRQQDALREIELVARFDPTSPEGLIALGRQYMELGQRDRALATWHRILDVSRDRARGAVALAEVYADNAMLNESIEMYQEAVRLRPNELDFHRGLASVLERARLFDAAILEWRRVIELAQNDRDMRRHARESIVRIWGIQNRLPAQIAALETQFGHNPPDLEAGRDLAEALIRAHRPEDAERVLRRITELDPSDVISLVALERVLTQRGDLASAITVLRRLAEADPRRAREWYQRMAQHALALHRDEEAIEYATRAVQLNDQDATAHLHLAELYRARNDMGHAIASLRRAIELNDRLFPTYFELADLYLGFENQPARAVELYRRVIALAPDDDYVNRAGRQAIQIAPAAGLAEALERDLSAASAANPTRAVFRRLLVAYYDAVARPLINRVREGSAQESAHARQDLAHLGARAIAPLLDALADTDPAQQRIALDILGYLGNANAASALLAVAETTSADGEIRRRALAAAGALGDARALPRLVHLVSGQPETVLATIAAWSIAHVRGPAASAALVRVLETPGGPPEVRTMAALGLAGTRDPRARAALRSALGSDTQSSVRAAAAYGLGGGIDRSVLSILLVSLDTGNDVLRRAGAVALGASGATDVAVPALARSLFAPDDALRPGSNAPLRRVSAHALARLAGSSDDSRSRVFDDPALAVSGTRMLDALLDPPERADGAGALVRFRREITEAARDALRGLPERVEIAVRAFAEPDALDPLVDADGIAHVEGARQALTQMLNELVPAFAAHVTHPDLAIRRATVRTLSQIDSPDAVAALARAAADPDETLASMALAALARHGDDAHAFEAIAGRLDAASSWSLRAAAAARTYS